MLPCTICGDRVSFHAPCTRAHAHLCHACAELNLGGTPLDNPAHAAPPEPVPLVTADAQRVLREVPALRIAWLEDR